MNYPSIEIQNLLSENLLESLAQENSRHKFAQPESFSCEINSIKENKKNYSSQIADAYENLIARWDLLSSDFPSMNLSDLREKWVKYFFSQFGFDLQYQKSAIEADSGNKFVLSYRGWEGANAPIVHSSSFQQDLDDRSKEQTRKYSPHDTLQRFLNQSNSDLWGIVTNGRYLRILRDFSHQSRKAYIQFDLEMLFEGRHYEDFRILYRLIHPSRFMPKEDEKCILENLFEESKSAGVAIGEDLRKNISSAIESLANGFLIATPDLLNKLVDNTENCMQFYQQILRIIYRILFLFYAEQRRLMPTRSTLYAQEYSLSSLRDKIERGETIDEEQFDLWEGLKATFNMVYHGVEELGITPYNGQLFNPDSIHWLINSQCRNDKLLMAIKYMSLFEKEGIPHRISYTELNVDEIGAIYESLLEYIPRISSKMENLGDTNKKNTPNSHNEISPNTFFLDPRGTSRKTSGSYYTHPGLVNALIESALIPVVETKIEEAGPDKDNQEKALLSLKICDPACGSAAFLISATEYLGEKLAKIRIQDDYPNDTQIRHARRDVLRHCIYGVDLNPMAVELAKVSLWLTAATNDLPLNFLDHRIKCGNSLIGATPELIKKGIPPEAYSPVEGDDKNIARERMKIAREYCKRRELEKYQLIFNLVRELERVQAFQVMDLSEKYGEDSTQEQKEIEKAYKKSRENDTFKKNKYIADFWTAAFFWKHNDDAKNYPTSMMLDYLLENETVQLSGELANGIEKIAEEYKFFHWHLEFPEVFVNGGFDCVLGNPPWDKIKPDKRQFLSLYHSGISAFNASERKRVLKELLKNIDIKKEFDEYIIRFSILSKYFKYSKNYQNQFCTIDGKKQGGDNNSYMFFLEKCFNIIKKNAFIGLILPNGFVGDLGSAGLRKLLFKNGTLNVWKMRNKSSDEYFFPSVAPQAIIILLSYYKNPNHILKIKRASSMRELNHNFEDKDIFTLDEVTKTFPDTFDFISYSSDMDAIITRKITAHHTFAEAWKVQIGGELHMTNDAYMFRSEETGIPLWEGSLTHNFSIEQWPKKYVEPKLFAKVKTSDFYHYRVVLRGILSDGARKVQCSVVPKGYALGNSLNYIKPATFKSLKEAAFVVGILNSYVVEYRVQQTRSGYNLNHFRIKQLPIPKLQEGNRLFDEIAIRVAKLVCTNVKFSEFWQKVMNSKWEKNCGLTDDNERIFCRAEIDVLVALLYKLSLKEICFILDPQQIYGEKFPPGYFHVLKNMEFREYGEYRTKRLILEKYDELKDKFKNL